jgi:superfamily I DNA and/or RNA helicase
VRADKQQVSRAARAAVIKEAEVVVCTLITSGGELLNLVLGEGLRFDALIIDEVRGPNSAL